MTNKWNASELKTSSELFTKVICDEFFKDKPKIGGSDIINLTEVKQLNFFVLKNLFEKWKLEVQNLRSPYFDFEESDVKKALEEFMNVLSRHIAVSRENFEPVLNKAFIDVVNLYQSPNQFFNDCLKNLPDFKLTQNWLAENGKFFSDYNWVLRELSSKLTGVNMAYANEAIDWVNELITNDNIEDHEIELNDLAKIIGDTSNKNSANPYQSFFDSIEAYKQSKPAASEEQTERNIEQVEKEESIKFDDVPAQKPEIKIEPKFAELIDPVLAKSNEHETYNGNSKETLNEIIQKANDKESLSDFHQKKKIDSIGSSLSLNQRFIFINNLFGGVPDNFNHALKELEECNSFSEAKDQMLKKYMTQYKWNMNNPETEEFLDLLKRRYN
jgi:hypothetical protein